MKKNYFLKTIQTIIAVFALMLTTGQTTAQVATDYTYNLRTIESTDYAAGAMTMISDEISLEGATFKIQAAVTPSSNDGGAFVGSNGSKRWGVGDVDSENATTTIDGNHGDAAVINSITIVDFNDNGTGYTEASISNVHFSGIYIRGGNGANDSPKVTVDGTNPGPFELGQLGVTQQFVVFGEEFLNAASTPFTIGAAGEVTSITLENATTNFQNSFQIVGTTVKYTFTTDPSLSVDDIIKDASSLVLYPNPVKDKISLNISVDSVEIIDMMGRVVKTATTNSIDVSDLVSGAYILKAVSTSGDTLTKRFVK